MENNPNIFDMTKHLTEAGITWATKDSLSIVNDVVLKDRRSICEKCEHWDRDGFFGIGKCKICGCSAAKLYVPSSICPLHPPKWVNVPSDK